MKKIVAVIFCGMLFTCDSCCGIRADDLIALVSMGTSSVNQRGIIAVLQICCLDTDGFSFGEKGSLLFKLRQCAWQAGNCKVAEYLDMMGKGPSDVAVFLTSDRGAGTRTDRAVAADAEKARKLIAMALNSWGWQKVQGWRSVSGYSLFGLTEKITDPKYREALRGVLQDFGLTDDAQPEHELLASKLDKAIGPLMSGAYAKPVPLVASFFRALLLRCRCSDDFLIDLWRRHRNLWGEPGHDQFFWNEACIDFGFPDSDLRTWSDFAALTRRLRLALEMVGGIEGIGVTHIVGALLGGHLKSFATSEDLELLFSWIDHYIAGGNREQLISHKDARYGTLKSICIGMIDTAEKTKIMRFFRQRGFFSPVAFEIKEAWAKDED